MPIKAITFDFGGTLVESKMDLEGFHRALTSLLQSYVGKVELSEVKSAIDAALVCLAETQSDGREMTFEQVYEDALNRLSCQANPTILRQIRDLYVAHSSPTFYSCSDDLISKLSEKYPVGLICNTILDVPRELVAGRGWDKYLTVMVLSRDVGFRKPRPEIFMRALESLGVEGEEILHVGDSLVADVAGVLTVGGTPVWISHGRDSKWRGYKIEDVCDLPSLLRKIV